MPPFLDPEPQRSRSEDPELPFLAPDLRAAGVWSPQPTSRPGTQQQREQRPRLPAKIRNALLAEVEPCPVAFPPPRGSKLTPRPALPELGSRVALQGRLRAAREHYADECDKVSYRVQRLLAEAPPPLQPARPHAPVQRAGARDARDASVSRFTLDRLLDAKRANAAGAAAAGVGASRGRRGSRRPTVRGRRKSAVRLLPLLEKLRGMIHPASPAKRPASPQPDDGQDQRMQVQELDLAYYGLRPADLLMLREVLVTQKRMIKLDLSGNSLSTLQDHRLLRELLCSGAAVVQIVLDDSRMHPTRADELRELAAANGRRVRASIGRKQRLEVQTAVDDTAERHLRERTELVAEERAGRRSILDDQRTLRKDMADAQALSLRILIRRAERAALRKRQCAERQALRDHERGCRSAVLTSWWLELLALVDGGYDMWREQFLKEHGQERAALRQKQSADWHSARAIERARRELERRRRREVETAEIDARFVISGERDKAFGLLRAAEVSGRSGVIRREQDRRAMQCAEAAGRREVVGQEEQGFRFILDRRVLEIQQHSIMQLKQRRRLGDEEAATRALHEQDEQVIRPIFEEIICGFRDFLNICQSFEDVVSSRGHLLAVVPDVRIQAPRLAQAIGERPKPHRHVIGQQGDWLTVPGPSLNIGMPADWVDQVMEVEAQEEASWELQQRRMDMQRGIAEKYRSQLTSAGGSHVLDMLHSCLADMGEPRGGGGAGDAAAPTRSPQWATADQLSVRKCRIWGGTVVVSLRDDPRDGGHQYADDDRLAHPYKGPTEKQLSTGLSMPVVDTEGREMWSQRFAGSGQHSGSTSNTGRAMTLHLPADGSLTVEALAGMLAEVKYRTDVSPTDVKFPFMRRVEYDVWVRFSYSDRGAFSAAGATDPYLRAGDGLAAPSRLTEVHASAHTYVVVVQPYIHRPPSGPMIWQEGDEKSMAQSILSGIQVKCPPVVTWGEDASVVVSGGGRISSFNGGVLEIAFIEGFAPEDHVCMRGTAQCTMSPDGKRFMWKESAVAAVKQGVLPLIGSVGALPGCQRVVFQFLDEKATEEAVRRLLERLRFHNTSKDPTTGLRRILCRLTDVSGFRASLVAEVQVEATDDPAELILVRSQLTFHVPNGMSEADTKERGHFVESTCLPLFRGARIEDPDTEYFIGGSVKVRCTHMQRHDSVQVADWVSRDPPLPEAKLRIVGDTVYYDGKVLGTLSTLPAEEIRKRFSALRHTPRLRGATIARMAMGSTLTVEREEMSAPLLGAGVPAEAAPAVDLEASSRQDPPGRAVSGKLGQEPAAAAPAATGSGSATPGPAAGGSKDGQDNADILSKVVSVFSAPPPPTQCNREISLKITESGDASLTAVQEFLRAIVFVNHSHNPSTATTRLVDVHLKLGPTVGAEPDTDEPQELMDQVSVRVTPALFHVASRFSTIRYQEGSGSQKLTVFDVVHEQFVDSYDGGYVSAEIVEGFESAKEVVTLKDGDGIATEFREWLDASSTQEDWMALHGAPKGLGFGRRVSRRVSNMKVVQGAAPAAGGGLALPFASVEDAESDSSSSDGQDRRASCVDPGNGLLSLTKRQRSFDVLRKAAKGIGALEVSKRRAAAPEAAAASSDKDSGRMCQISEVLLEQRSVGFLFLDAARGQMCVRFSRGTGVKRRDVLTLLRNLVYRNASNKPDSRRRYIRVSLNSGSWMSSHVVLALDIQTVDDVTEVLVREDRLRYRQSNAGAHTPLCLAPLHSGCVYDADTDFFDGGHLTVEVIAGGAKGDALGLLSPEQQIEQIKRTAYLLDDSEREERGRVRYACLSNPEDYVFEVVDKKIRLPEAVGGGVCFVSYPRSASIQGVTDLRLSFPRPAEGDSPCISLNVITYLLNCVHYAPPDRTKEGIRTYQIRVSDGQNPQEGKGKVSVDVRLPLLTLSPAAGATEVAAGTTASPTQRVTIGALFTAEGSPITSGYMSVELTGNLCPDTVPGAKNGDALIPNLKAVGMRQDGGNLFLGPTLLAQVMVDWQYFRVDFVSGGRIVRAQLQQLLHSLQYRAATLQAKDAAVDGAGGVAKCVVDFSQKEIVVCVAEEGARDSQISVPIKSK